MKNMNPQLAKTIAEYVTFKRLITETYPTGIVSIVSDTFDLWGVISEILPRLKGAIMARDGKVVIRPDSGDPVKIVSGYLVDEIGVNDEGYYDLETMKPLTDNEVKGMIVCLEEIFGHTVTSTGYMQLDQHIGAIYGDSITLERAKQICERLERKGFASTNIVFGIGSFTYQGEINDKAIVTRDTHMFAVKSTYGEVIKDGELVGVEIFKDPKTDNGMKKSAKGLTAVYEKPEGGFYMKDQATWDEVKNCAFVKVFSNGKMTKTWTLAEVRANAAKSI